jgi:hypothetical protein
MLGTVTRQTFRRDHWRIHVELADGTALDVELRDSRAPELGAAVAISVDPADVIALPD